MEKCYTFLIEMVLTLSPDAFESFVATSKKTIKILLL